MTTKLILKANTFNSVLGVINDFYNQSKFFNNTYKNYIRFYSDGNNILHLVCNNLDLKIINYFDIELGQAIDKIYLIQELINIITKLKSYQYFIIENDNVVFDDGKISLVPIQLDKEELDEKFGIDVNFDYTSQFAIDEPLNNEVKKIFKIIDLKNKKFRNTYFNDAGHLYFDFYDIRAKKSSFFDYINSDIFSLKIVASLLALNVNQEAYIDKPKDKFLINSTNFYVEGHQMSVDKTDKEYLKNLFICDRTQVVSIKAKLELLYYVDVVSGYDQKSTLYFGNGKVKANSSNAGYLAEFTIEDADKADFNIPTETLLKILKFVIGYTPKISFFEFSVITNDMGKFIVFKANDVEILNEVI